MRLVHPYHLVTNSPWPITTSISALSIAISLVLAMHNKEYGEYILIASLLSLVVSIIAWLQDITIEGTYRGEHTSRVQKGLTLGFILFVVSEVCVFLTLFFAYFYNSLVPSVEVGSVWPPIGIVTLDYKAVPLVNTLILLSSGFSITASHNYMLSKSYSSAFLYLALTIGLGLGFSLLQYLEYSNTYFTISDSVYGSSFFLLTGCHALHILVGTTFLLVCLVRMALSHFTSSRHLLFTYAAIYWHMVDAVWLVLFVVVYCWA